MADEFCLKMPDFHVTFRDFTCRKSTTWNKRLYFPSEGRRDEDFFRPEKSDGFLRVWTRELGVPKASTLPVDHRSRYNQPVSTFLLFPTCPHRTNLRDKALLTITTSKRDTHYLIPLVSGTLGSNESSHKTRSSVSSVFAPWEQALFGVSTEQTRANRLFQTEVQTLSSCAL